MKFCVFNMGKYSWQRLNSTSMTHQSTCVKAHYSIGRLQRLQRLPCVKPMRNRKSVLMATNDFGEVTVTFDHPILISSSLCPSGYLAFNDFLR